MDGRFHNNSIHLRVNDRLLAAAEAKARATGISLSELVRQAVTREVRPIGATRLPTAQSPAGGPF